MKKLNVYSLILSATVLLSACSSMTNSISTSIANAEMQKKQLANGKTVYLDYNLTPTADWNCQVVGTPQSYNWSQLKMEGQFHVGGASGLLTQRALNYANQQRLNTNYINLYIPPTQSFATGSSPRVTKITNLTPNAQAVATFYQCQSINPQHKIGVIKGRGETSVFENRKPNFGPSAGGLY